MTALLSPRCLQLAHLGSTTPIMTHATHLAVPVFADSVERLRESILAAVDAGATLVELRLDLCEDVSDDDVRTATANLPGNVLLLLTNRSVSQGGQCEDADAERLARIDRLASAFDLIDVELETWRRSEDNRNLIRRALSHPSGRRAVDRRRLVLSIHDFRGRPKSLQKDLLACVEEPSCDIVKVAWHARSVRDCLEAFEIVGTCPKPAIAPCMGELGAISRILAPKFRAFATFASLNEASATAPGQPTIAELKSVYRWDAQRPSTAVYGVIGHPVGHSMSPRVHNAVFAETDLDAVYVPLDVAPGYEALKAFLLEVEARRDAGFRGFSVTIPHKEHAIRFLREGGGAIDRVAERVGAVNTLAYADAAGWRGTNTDYQGALDAITSGLGVSRDGLKGLRVTVLGAGGASRAVVAALVDHGAVVRVSNRTPERAAALADTLGVALIPWERRADPEAELIVNCTSVGMGQDASASPWVDDAFPGSPAVFDTVYNPSETQLLRAAKRAGCQVVGGLAMFAAQAAAQWTFWRGAIIDGGVYPRIVERAAILPER